MYKQLQFFSTVYISSLSVAKYLLLSLQLRKRRKIYKLCGCLRKYIVWKLNAREIVFFSSKTFVLMQESSFKRMTNALSIFATNVK